MYCDLYVYGQFPIILVPYLVSTCTYLYLFRLNFGVLSRFSNYSDKDGIAAANPSQCSGIKLLYRLELGTTRSIYEFMRSKNNYCSISYIS